MLDSCISHILTLNMLSKVIIKQPITTETSTQNQPNFEVYKPGNVSRDISDFAIL